MAEKMNIDKLLTRKKKWTIATYVCLCFLLMVGVT